MTRTNVVRRLLHGLVSFRLRGLLVSLRLPLGYEKASDVVNRVPLRPRYLFDLF